MKRAPMVIARLLGASLLGASLCCVIWIHESGKHDLAERPEPATGRPGAIRGLHWLYAQRAYPLKTIPPGARMRAIEQLDREERRFRKVRASLGAHADEQLIWSPLGPAPIGQGQTFGLPRVSVSGRVSIVVLDPGYNGTTNQTVYLGAATGGVWRSRDNGATWSPLTDQQPSLAMGALAIDPTNLSIIYAGTGEAHFSGDSYYGSGLLKSVDGGATWTQITGPRSSSEPGLPSFLNASFHALVIDPRATSTLYAATEIGAVSSAVGFATDAPLGDRGIWKSTDGGLNWRNLNPAGSLNRSGTDVLLDPGNSNRVFAAVREQGIYRSNAGGEPGTWEKLGNGLPESGFFRIKLAAGARLPSSATATLFAVFATNFDSGTLGELLGIYRSTDSGSTWMKLNSPPDRSQQLNYDLALAVDPIDANIIYYGTATNAVLTGGTLWRTRDGGATWTDISVGDGITGGLHADTHWIAVSPANRDTLFTANDGGVWRTDNATGGVVAWTSLNQTLNITQFYTIALHPADPNILLGGTQDNGTNRYDGSAIWSHVRGGDGGAVLIDQFNGQVMYHTFANFNNFGGFSPRIGPEISLDGGNTWTRRGCFGCTAQPGGFHPADRLSTYAPMALHPGFKDPPGNVVYFGTHRIYRSANLGDTWVGLGPSSDGFGADVTKGILPDSSGYSFSYVSAIAVHPALDRTSDPPGETLWVGTADGLVRFTANAGALASASFTNATKAPLPNRFVTDIALHPDDRRLAWVSYSGFNANTPSTPGHVFVTADQGATWRDISGNLPDIPVNSIAVDPLLANVVYVGTDVGVFRTLDGGASWTRLANGIPNVPVFVLRYHTATRSLVAATHGRGVFRLSLSRVIASVSAASYRRTGLAIEGIATAFGESLATTTASAPTLVPPTNLEGTTVLVRDSLGMQREAPIFSISPTQVNYQIPPGTAPGPAAITITSGAGSVSVGTEQIAIVAPGLFSANASGQEVAAAYAVRVRDGVQTREEIFEFSAAQNKFVSKPLDLGPPGDIVVLVLFGTGIRGRSDQAAVSCRIGGQTATVHYASLAPVYAGLDQVNVELSRTLAGRGEVDVVLTVEGRIANTVTVNIR